MITKELILFGSKPGEMEVLLCEITRAAKSAGVSEMVALRQVKAAAARDGFTTFREWIFDGSAPKFGKNVLNI